MPPPAVPALVAVGGRILASTFNGGVRSALSWLLKDAPTLQVVASAAQDITTTGWNALSLPTVLVDNAGLMGSSASRVYIGRQLGWYLVSGVVAWGSATTGTERRTTLWKNGTDIVVGSYNQTGTPLALAAVVLPPVLVAATDPGDFIELTAAHDAPASIQTGVLTYRTSSLTAVYVRTL